MEKVVVVVLRRNPEELESSQLDALKACLPGKEVEFVRTDPQDYREHDERCRELNAVAVILPLERPIPSLAMERGVPHLVFLPDGQVGKLKPLVPEFEPFKG